MSLNINAKILSKIVANEIQEHIKIVIHYVHVGFIQESQDWVNICELRNGICCINNLPQSHRINAGAHLT